MAVPDAIPVGRARIQVFVVGQWTTTLATIRFGGREATVILKGTRIGYIFKDAVLLRRREFDKPALEAEIAPDYDEYVAEVRSRASA